LNKEIEKDQMSWLQGGHTKLGASQCVLSKLIIQERKWRGKLKFDTHVDDVVLSNHHLYYKLSERNLYISQ